MTRIQVSTTNTTTLRVSATSGGSAVPDGTPIVVMCASLSYSATGTAAGGEASFTIPTATGRRDLELLDATIRVGSNPPVSIAFETQAEGGPFTSAITVSDESITVYGGTGNGRSYEYRSVDTTHALDSWDLMVDIDTSGGDVTLTLPFATTTGDQMILVSHGGNVAKVKARHVSDKMNGKTAGTALEATIGDEDYLAIRVMTSNEMAVENATAIAGS